MQFPKYGMSEFPYSMREIWGKNKFLNHGTSEFPYYGTIWENTDNFQVLLYLVD